ncbi:MAG: AraC family transcriptional regulator [Sphaerochaeta sp.]|nr:AraC family transcriptional regulator [Sphaerochaeta sp.]
MDDHLVMDPPILKESTYFHDPTMQLKVIKRDPEIPYRLHGHEFHELVVIQSGRGITYTNEVEYSVGECSVFYVPPGALHGYKELDHLVLYNIIWGDRLIKKQTFDLEQLPGFTSIFAATEVVMMHLTPSQFTELIPVIQLLEKECDDLSYGSGSRIAAYAYLLEVFVTLSRIFDQTPNSANRTARLLWDIFAHMDERLDEPITTEELTTIAAMSSSTLNRTFKRATGLSPIEFHIHKRIAKACTLIQQRGLSMAQVGEACGFTDPNYFSRQFRKVMGMSPKQYQRIFTSRFA